MDKSTPTKNDKMYAVIGTIIGLGFLVASMYAMHLSIRVNRLSLKKFKDEGYV